MAENMFRDVGVFHEKFNLPTSNPGAKYRKPQLLSLEEFEYRLGFLKEELLEFHASHEMNDLEGAADALADLVWVALGTAHYMGLPMDRIWAEVRRANMDKVLATVQDPTHKRGNIEVVKKPIGWQAPKLKPIIDEAAK